MALKQGILITFEGGEGSGKTTQISMLSGYLKKSGYNVVTTREPGGTPEAEKIRNLLVQREGGDWSPMAECLLLFAGRVMHVENLIKPALAAGSIVLSDRFTDSTRAYQSYGYGLPRETVEEINRLTLGDFRPGLTFIFDMPVAEGLARAGKRLAGDKSKEDRYERLDMAFHERLRQGYLQIAENEPDRCHLLDAEGTVEDVAAAVRARVIEAIKG